jgi:hypothetical protein
VLRAIRFEIRTRGERAITNDGIARRRNRALSLHLKTRIDVVAQLKWLIILNRLSFD